MAFDRNYEPGERTANKESGRSDPDAEQERNTPAPCDQFLPGQQPAKIAPVAEPSITPMFAPNTLHEAITPR